MGFTDTMKSMLADSHDGSVSSKRVVTLLAFLLCATAFIANLFWDYKIDEFIYNSMVFVVISGLGVTGLEKFATTKIVRRMK
jgi:hypothetical protein